MSTNFFNCLQLSSPGVGSEATACHQCKTTQSHNVIYLHTVSTVTIYNQLAREPRTASPRLLGTHQTVAPRRRGAGNQLPPLSGCPGNRREHLTSADPSRDATTKLSPTYTPPLLLKDTEHYNRAVPLCTEHKWHEHISRHN